MVPGMYGNIQKLSYNNIEKSYRKETQDICKYYKKKLTEKDRWLAEI